MHAANHKISGRIRSNHANTVITRTLLAAILRGMDKEPYPNSYRNPGCNELFSLQRAYRQW